MLTPYNYGGKQKQGTVSTPKFGPTGGGLKPYVYPETPGPTKAQTYQADAVKSAAEAAKANSVGGFALNTVKAVGSQFKDAGVAAKNALFEAPAPKSLDMQAALSAGWDTVSKNIQDTASRFQQLPRILDKNTSVGDKAIIAGRAGLGALNTAFLGITAPLEAARGIPGAGYVADAAHNIFGAIGTGTGELAGGAVDRSPFSQATKDKIRPLVVETAALAGMVAAGEVGVKVKAKIAENSKAILDTIHGAEVVNNIRQPKVVGDSVETPVQFNNRYTPDAQLPTIDAGPPAKSSLPSIQIGDGATKAPAGLSYEPFKEAAKLGTLQPFDYSKVETKVSPEKVSVPNETRTQSTPESIPTVADASPDNTFKSRVYERMKAENPTAFTGDVKAQHVRLTDDAERAVSLVEKDKQTAFELAMGAKSSPDVLSTSANIALAEKALDEGNNALAARLVVKRSLDQTRRGQEISAEQLSVSGNSTSDYVKQLIGSRLRRLGDSYLSDLKVRDVSKAQKAVKKIDQEVAALEGQIKAKKLDTKTAIALLDKLQCV